MKDPIKYLVESYKIHIEFLAGKIRPECHKDPFFDKRTKKLLKEINERRMKDWKNYPGRSKELKLLMKAKEYGTLFANIA